MILNKSTFLAWPAILGSYSHGQAFMALLFTNSIFTLVLMFSIVFPKTELFIRFLKKSFSDFLLDSIPL